MNDELISCEKCDSEADVVFFIRQLSDDWSVSSALCFAHGAVSVDDVPLYD